MTDKKAIQTKIVFLTADADDFAENVKELCFVFTIFNTNPGVCGKPADVFFEKHQPLFHLR
jgi:hypothetical protein